NRLLALLQAMRASHSWRALYLASATPMQMHPHEAWDLLELLGLNGQWAHSAAGFLRYYSQLRDPFGARQWEFLRRMSADVLAPDKAGRTLDLEATIPHREVRDRFVPMTPAEERLYRRIETYISRYYNAYLSGPAAQRPLGFIMTIYRRRLTSSFLAIERSLRRRRKVLLERASADALLDADDLAAIEFSFLLDPDELPEVGQNIAEEVNEIDDFLEEL